MLYDHASCAPIECTSVVASLASSPYSSVATTHPNSLIFEPLHVHTSPPPHHYYQPLSSLVTPHSHTSSGGGEELNAAHSTMQPSVCVFSPSASSSSSGASSDYEAAAGIALLDGVYIEDAALAHMSVRQVNQITQVRKMCRNNRPFTFSTFNRAAHKTQYALSNSGDGR